MATGVFPMVRNSQPSILLHTFKMVFVLFWVMLFSYPAAWHLTTTDREFRRYHIWRKSSMLVDEKVYPFADFLHMVTYPVHNAALKGKPTRIAKLAPEAEALNLHDYFNFTPLAYATINGDIEMMKGFIASGADPDMILSGGTTALHQAMISEDENAALVLLESGARADIADIDGRTSLHICANNQMLKVFPSCLRVEFDLNKKDSKGLTPLDYAIKKGSYQMVTDLARAGAQPVFANGSRDISISIFLAQWQKTGDYQSAIDMVEENARKYYKSGPDRPVPAELPVDFRIRPSSKKPGDIPDEDL